MKTTITLDEDLVAQVMQVTSARTKTRAITIALREHIRRKKIDRLRSLLGKVEIDEQAVQELRKLELEEAAPRNG